MPSSLRFFSICLLLALEARSSADIAQPILAAVAGRMSNNFNDPARGSVVKGSGDAAAAGGRGGQIIFFWLILREISKNFRRGLFFSRSGGDDDDDDHFSYGSTTPRTIPKLAAAVLAAAAAAAVARLFKIRRADVFLCVFFSEFPDGFLDLCHSLPDFAEYDLSSVGSISGAAATAAAAAATATRNGSPPDPGVLMGCCGGGGDLADRAAGDRGPRS